MMWIVFYSIIGLGVLFYAVRPIGKHVVKNHEKFEEKKSKLNNDLANVSNSINRYKTLKDNVTRFHKEGGHNGFIGLDAGSNTVAEHTNEYPNEITGHQVDVWIYNNSAVKEPERIIVAGHANSPVCREVSAALSTAYYRREKIHKDDFFVTGAGVLVNNELPDISNKESVNAFYERMLRKEITSLSELKSQLYTYERITGLVNVHTFSMLDYQTVLKTIQNKIKDVFRSGKSAVFGNNDPQLPGMLLDVPFYQWHLGKLVPLTVTINETDLNCEEFKILKDRHQQSLVREMKDDVKRRNRIYKDWLDKDLTKERQLRMADPSEIITISGHRDYDKAEVVSDSNSTSISIGEYLDVHLPSLVKEDERWINRTDFELKRLMKHEKTAGLASTLNYTLLVDSFLRGWPSIFFVNMDERKLYDEWLEKKRAKVWEKISINLLEQGIDPTGILHTNIVFKVNQSKGGQLLIEPHYFLLSNAYMMAVDVEQKIVRYVHPWEHREHMHLINDGEKIPEENLKQYTENLIDEGMKYLEEGQWEHARQLILLALRCDAIPSFTKLTSIWWDQLTKDTSQLYKDRLSDPYFQSLLAGLSLPDNPDHNALQQRRNDLNYCIEQKPDALPDPYLYLAVFEVFADYCQAFDHNREKYVTFARERMHQAQRDFEKGLFLPEVLQGGAVTNEDINKLADPVYSSNSTLYPEKERIYEKVFFQGLIFTLKDLGYYKLKEKMAKAQADSMFAGILDMEVGQVEDDLQKIQEQAMRDYEKQNIVQVGINAFATGEMEAAKDRGKPISLFNMMLANAGANAFLERAKKIDAKYVEECFSRETILQSGLFWRMIGPFSEIVKANHFVEINNWIVYLAILWEDYPASKYKMKDKIKEFKEIKFPLSQDQKATSSQLDKVKKQLEQYVISAEKDMYIPMGELRSLQADFLNSAAKIFKDVPMFDLMEGNKARVLIASQNHAAYKEAVKIMVEPGRSLQMLTRDINGTIPESSDIKSDDLTSIEFVQNNGTVLVNGITTTDQKVKVLELSGLTREDYEHIKTYFTRDDWKARINKLGANVGEMLLNTPLPHAPRVQRFIDILNDPEITALLVYIMAYSNEHLVADEMVSIYRMLRKAQFKTSANGFVVGGVRMDFDRIYNYALQTVQN